ncbi:tRNA A64-2'-O-ribosylphosphate transferase [Sporodiniella umbellata]|nr:tRNA A64-2'-O-ribosylphosphate transferase [Sporodiniella umbellata]
MKKKKKPILKTKANERCGSWYIDPTKREVHSAYFKSTDGHVNKWDFSVKRNNMHLATLIAQHKGCIIVDSTRKGKRFSDALSKTIPIWCSTINRTYDMLGKQDWDKAFYSLPSIVPRSEHDQIADQIPKFVEKLLESGYNLYNLAPILEKPFRPLWYSPQSLESLMLSKPNFDDLPFWPVICLSASEAVDHGYQSRPGYLYVQGSGDDHESWSHGLTPDIFWNNREYILESKAQCEERVKECVKNSLSSKSIKKTYTFIRPTPIAIGNKLSTVFDVVIDCTDKESELPFTDYLDLPTDSTTKGRRAIPENIKKAIEFAREPLSENQKILIHCEEDTDQSVGLLLAILTEYFDVEGNLCLENRPPVDKKVISKHLVRITSCWSKASPKKATINRVHEHFLSSPTTESLESSLDLSELAIIESASSNAATSSTDLAASNKDA